MVLSPFMPFVKGTTITLAPESNMQYLSSSEVVAFNVPTFIAETCGSSTSGMNSPDTTQRVRPLNLSLCNTVPLGGVLEFQVLEAVVVWVDPDVGVPSSKVPSTRYGKDMGFHDSWDIPSLELDVLVISGTNASVIADRVRSPGLFLRNTDPLGLELEFQSWKAGVVWIDSDVVVPSSKVPSIGYGKDMAFLEIRETHSR